MSLRSPTLPELSVSGETVPSGLKQEPSITGAALPPAPVPPVPKPMASPEHLSCHLPILPHWDLKLWGRWGMMAKEAAPGERVGSGQHKPPGPLCEWVLED